MICLDIESNGVDWRHGTMPFFFTSCNTSGDQIWYEWDVNPITREPFIPEGDKLEIRAMLETDEELLGQNIKFDVTGLITAKIVRKWDWSKTHDTIVAAHLLASSLPKSLDALAVQYLGRDITPFEDAIEKMVHDCRTIVRREYPEWRIAKAGLPDMPSAKEKTWKFDMWLPRALAIEKKLPDDHPWFRGLREYANPDPVVTLEIWPIMKAELERRGLWEIYECRRKLPRILYEMEEYGVTWSGERLGDLSREYKAEAEKAERICMAVSASLGHELEMPKGGVNNSLRALCFDVMKLPKVIAHKSKSGNASLDKNTMDHYLNTLPKNSKPAVFLRNLVARRKRMTAVQYMEGYCRFGRELPKPLGWTDEWDWFRLHPSLNLTGTDTLRMSSSAPNEQNISKREGFNLRYCFGPAPGREWWSLDAENIELRIPAYESDEREFIQLFERPNDAPYFGSNHLLIAHILFPKQFEECLRDGVAFKERYKSTIYQDVKNGNFAVQYGAVDREDGMGTADRTYKLKGAQARIKKRFAKQEALNQYCISFAEEHGYVETIPDRMVCPERGYPLMCTRTEYGRIKPTVPLNYHVQGTAMWWMCKAMIRCQEQLDSWRKMKFDARIALQVHDELVFDLPKRGCPIKDPTSSNLGRIKVLKQLMEMGGEDISVPISVGVEYNPDNWSEGVKIKC